MFMSCRGEVGESTSASTRASVATVQTTTSMTTVSGDVCSTARSSTGRFEAESGQYAVYLTGMDVPRRSLAFDVIRFLRGDEAVLAYHQDFPDDQDGPPNDYYIVNDSRQVREAKVRDDVRVRLVRLHEDSDANLGGGTFDELPGYLAGYKPPDQPFLSSNPFWLTFENGTVKEICEQYVP